MTLVAAMEKTLLPIFEEVFHTYDDHRKILAAVGVLYITCKGLRIFLGCYSFIQSQIRSYFFRATNGIGKAYAEELASLGMNIILISRNKHKLQMVSESITRTYGVKTRFIDADFITGREVFPRIKDALKDVDVGILVNNAGVCYDVPQCVTDVPEDKIFEIINVNITAATMMVHLVLPGMIQRKKGAIINVSSGGSSLPPCPEFNVYVASKTFLDRFSQALHYEYASKGIFIQSLIPFFVVSNITTTLNSYILRKSLLVPLAKDFVHQAVRTIGVSRRTTGYWSHSIQLFVAQSLPEQIWVFCLGLFFKTIRNEYFFKK
uniref:3-ketoacyl-CoA reductase n=1 Tax=Leptobrachium leishanense TaxID=445787 RepID=A0A8C5PMZ3_9ANUR